MCSAFMKGNITSKQIIRSFLATASEFGTVGLKDGKPFVEVTMGSLDVERVLVSGKEMTL